MNMDAERSLIYPGASSEWKWNHLGRSGDMPPGKSWISRARKSHFPHSDTIVLKVTGLEGHTVKPWSNEDAS